MTSIHIPVLWIPAIPAGMTCFYRLVYKDERRSVGTIAGTLQTLRRYINSGLYTFGKLTYPDKVSRY